MKSWLRSLVPVILLAGVLVVMQWISGMPVTSLAIKTIIFFVIVVTIMRVLPWRRLVSTFQPSSRFYTPLLFGLFVRHFALIIITESRRVLTARSLSVRKNWAPWSFRSLAYAVSSLFTRSLDRAERFYAAQRLRGISG